LVAYGNKKIVTSLLWLSKILLKLSKILSASWSVDLIYDDDVKLFGKNHTSPGMQFKSLIGVGLSVKL